MICCFAIAEVLNRSKLCTEEPISGSSAAAGAGSHSQFFSYKLPFKKHGRRQTHDCEPGRIVWMDVVVAVFPNRTALWTWKKNKERQRSLSLVPSALPTFLGKTLVNDCSNLGAVYTHPVSLLFQLEASGCCQLAQVAGGGRRLFNHFCMWNETHGLGEHSTWCVGVTSGTNQMTLLQQVQYDPLLKVFFFLWTRPL